MKAIEVACTAEGCKEKRRVVPTSPAAPVLSALEKLEKEGWGYEIGFFTMLTGQHNQLCPKHAKGKM